MSEASTTKRDYDPITLERRWQERWAESGLYRTDENPEKTKHYALTCQRSR